MGKKLDALLGRSFKTSKFKAMASLAISRLAVLKNQRQARCSIARSDVVEFLKNGNHERALLRVEQVIKEQNMLDVFVVLESYCHLLVERINLIQQEKVCPEELHEAVSTLIYAATRCGEFPELREIRTFFTSCYGKEFAARAVELRNNCGVNPRIIQKLSTRMPSLENKMKVLQEIASDNNIDLPIQETVSDITLENQDSGQEKKQRPSPSSPSGVSAQGDNNKQIQLDEVEMGEGFSDSVKMRRKYRDVADAAQEAFKSAAYAAAAARAAVELSRSESTDPDDPNLHPRRVSIEPIKPEDSPEDEEMKTEMKFDKIFPVQNCDLETKTRHLHVERSFSNSSSDSFDDNAKEVRISVDQDDQIKQRDVVFDESDNEDAQKSRNDIAEGSSRTQSIEPLNINRRPISVRTRWANVR
ncbi:Spindle pole body protein [Handroanthus impetiginosus]|uniref:Spindle pole body protein n=1 Tax=Handroanthus impetiginosus TaxID=429701 RepID=A0A2G9G5Q3_9LAMI|nr:Spindle pole body protein [Handroanthus impetiginosus]